MSGHHRLPADLDCDHCGEPAIRSEDGLFYDGDGDACMSCGYPGHVVVYEDESDGDDEDAGGVARWELRDGSDDVCKWAHCIECAPFRDTPRDAAKEGTER